VSQVNSANVEGVRGNESKRAEAEPRADEQEQEEPNTEHEEIWNGRNEQETFGIEREIDEENRNRMKSFAEILTRGSEEMRN
jgi:hypothetical protein